MAETRNFPLGTVLSITTGRLVAPDGMAGVYKILNFMTVSSLFTHQLPRAAEKCLPALVAAHPHLSGEALAAELDLLDKRIEDHGPEQGVGGWMEEMTARFGDSFPVSPLASYAPTDPLADLVEMVGPGRADKIIVVESPTARHETQASIGKWARETFPGGDDLSPVHALRFLEEAAELCRAAGASQAECLGALDKGYRGLRLNWTDPDPSAVPGEMADVEITLRVLAERRGVDLQEAVDIKMAINRSRDWISHGDGTGHHLKAEAAPDA